MLYEITIREKSKPTKFFIDHSHLDDLKGYLQERHINPPLPTRGKKVPYRVETNVIRGRDSSTQYDFQQPVVVRGTDVASQYEYNETYPFPVPRAPPPEEIVLQPEQEREEEESNSEEPMNHLFPKPPYVVEAEIRMINGIRTQSGLFVLKKKVKNQSNTKGYSLKVVGNITAFPSKQAAIDYSYTI